MKAHGDDSKRTKDDMEFGSWEAPQPRKNFLFEISGRSDVQGQQRL